MNLDQLKTTVDEMIRGGKRGEAAVLLNSLKGKPIPRIHVNSLANLARRAGELNLALQMMSPIIRPKVTLDEPASDEEKATYAIILLGFGANSEALEILENSDEKNADVNLALAFTYINCWDYAAAIPKLKNYLKFAQVPPYQKMIAKVNLAASYVATGQAEEGFSLLQEILSETQENSWWLLHKNSLEISAQIAIQQKKWDDAVRFLSQAVGDGGQKFNLDSVFIAKWQAIIGLLRDGATDSTLEKLTAVREAAIRNKHWETIRDCDYYKAITTRDQDLALNLFFGTPFASYRKRLMMRAEEWLDIPKEYRWQIGAGPSPRVFHLGLGEEAGGTAKLKVGSTLFKGLQILTSDFYRPFSVGTLHSLVFPKEHFNPDSSPRRVSSLLHRLREWFQEFQLPLSVVAEKDGFRLQAGGPFVFVMEKPLASQSRKNEEDSQAGFLALYKKLKAHPSEKPLSAGQMAEITGVSVRSIRYFLNWAQEKNKVRKIGSGRETRYRMK